MEWHLHIVGVLLILLALLHIGFPKRFRWKDELGTVKLLTRQIMYVHTFFIGLVVFLMGILSLFYAHLLLHQSLGQVICFGLAIFWLCRLFFQWFVYSKELWRGKGFETIIHYLFSFLWIYISIVYLLAAYYRL